MEASMRIVQNEKGQMLVLTALSFAIFLAFAGLALDVGTMFAAKRLAQTGADTAAIAAALESYDGGAGSCTTQSCAAQNAATQNGIPNASTNVTLNTGSNITSSYHNGSGYVQAIVTVPIETVFMGMFHNGTIPVTASAIAGSVPSAGCFYTLGSSGITGSGTGSISTPGCDIEDNGGITMSGSENLSANQINIEGSYVNSGSGTASPMPTHFSGATNPLASLTPPTVPSSCTTLVNSFSGIQAGQCYSIVSSGTNTITLATSNTPYIFTGITASGSLDITGTGVTIYMPSGGITGSGNIGLNITAPTSGPYDGIGLWLASNNSSGITLSGSSTTGFEGIILAPDSNLTFSGSTALSLTADLIVSNVTFSGSTTINDYQKVNSGTALAKVGLVE
jgi:Flp pilus assembly protein TadG